jgi:hypothetical protein
LDYITLNDLEDRIHVGEGFFIYLIFSPINYLLAGLLSRGEEILYDEGLVGELFKILIRELCGLGLSFVYLLGLRVFFTFLEFRWTQFFFSTRSTRISSSR